MDSTSGTGADAPSPGLLGGRFRLREELGSGATATVFAAVDEAVGRPAAVKRLRTAAPLHVGRFAREIATLRALDVPGVVRVLDAGEDEEGTWLAMELVEGQPFPGGPLPWEVLRPTALALLRTLAGLHRHGVAHGDLGPHNVLVTPDGSPTLLDFGLARALGPEEPPRLDGPPAGTLPFVAPEQWHGAAAGPAADRFVAGLLLADTLLGLGLGAPGRRRAANEAVRQGRVREQVLQAPDLPEEARELVAALLHPDPAERGAGVPSFPTAAPATPVDRLGQPPPAALLRAVAGGAARRWRPALGACEDPLAVALDGLRTGGARARLLPAGAGPLGALEAAGWSPPATGSWGRVRAAAAAWAATQGAWVLDERHPPDPESLAVLRAARVGLLSVAPAHAVGRPLPVAALRALFQGPDRLLHGREDAARALRDRTGGHPAWVRRQVEAWRRLPGASLDEGGLRLPPAAARRLLAGADGLADDDPAPLPPLDDAARGLLATLVLARPGLRVEDAAAALGRPAWRLRRELAVLRRRGLAHRGSAGWRDLRAAAVVAELPPARRAALRAALRRALPEGHPARWRLALLDGDLPALGGEARRAAARHRAEARAAQALVVLEEALLLTRLEGRLELAWELARDLADLALATESVEETRRAAGALAPLREAGGDLGAEAGALHGLLEGASLARSQRSDAALARLAAPFAEPCWEAWRVALRTRAHLDCRDEAAAAAEVRALLAGLPPGARAPRGRALGLLGLLHYRAGDYRAAARSHGRSASLRDHPEERISARLNQASALLEHGDHAAAAARAQAALRHAEALRLGPYAIRAAWIHRAARYRGGEDLPVDEALVEAARDHADPRITALVALQEAAFAWRGGAPPEVLRACVQTVCAAAGPDPGPARLLAEALGCGPEEGAALLARAEAACPAVMAAQVAWVLPEGTPGRAEALARLLPRVPAARRGRWLEVARLP